MLMFLMRTLRAALPFALASVCLAGCQVSDSSRGAGQPPLMSAAASNPPWDLGDIAVNDATRSDFDQQPYIEDAKAGGDSDHEITGDDCLGMIVDECAPGL